MGAMNRVIDTRIEEFVGRADVRIRSSGKNGLIDAKLEAVAKSWPESAVVAPRLVQSLSLRFVRPRWVLKDNLYVRTFETYVASGLVTGVSADPSKHARPVRLLRGRLPVANDEIVVDSAWVERLASTPEGSGGMRLGETGLALLAKGGGTPERSLKTEQGPGTASTSEEAQRLNAGGAMDAGDRVEVIWFQKAPMMLKVVGIAPSPPLGGTPQGWMTVDGVALISGTAGKLSEIDIVLKPGVDANLFVQANKDRPELAGERTSRGGSPKVLLQTTERITSGLEKNLASNRMGFWIISFMTFAGGGFIIMTGMSTGVTERQRELGILRCIGAARAQLAEAQVLYGLIIGTGGAVIGVPIGVGLAWAALMYYQDKLGAEPQLVWWRVFWAFAGAAFTGVIGAVWPAWQASRSTPLQALAIRAQTPRRKVTRLITIIAIAGVLIHAGMFVVLHDPAMIFWGYFMVGLPAMLLGYFMLGVPAVLITSRLAGGAIERVLRLPAGMLRRTIQATPYRFGFTSSAMMAGLAMMVGIWTQGSAVLRDWIDQIKFPDAFVAGLSLSPDSQKLLNELPFVTATSAVTIQPVETDGFGVKGTTAFKTSFVAFEPASFFQMTKLNWVQGDPATAQARLEAGGAVIVAREFLTAKGLGVGSTFTCSHDGKTFTFDIVGVVTSPGLEMVGNMFDVGDGFVEQSVHAVFGSRKDLKEKFGSEVVQMIQISLDPKVSDDEALPKIRAKLITAGALAAGSGREIKSQITTFVGTALFISSGVGVFAMFVACFGVANLIIAGVQARQFEFGVLRAVGASQGLLVRLVLGEAVVIATTACVLGTMMGLQGAMGGNVIDRALWGLDVTPKPPVVPILAGCVVVFVMTCGAAVPAIVALGRKRPRELLGAVRG